MAEVRAERISSELHVFKEVILGTSSVCFKMLSSVDASPLSPKNQLGHLNIQVLKSPGENIDVFSSPKFALKLTGGKQICSSLKGGP